MGSKARSYLLRVTAVPGAAQLDWLRQLFWFQIESFYGTVVISELAVNKVCEGGVGDRGQLVFHGLGTEEECGAGEPAEAGLGLVIRFQIVLAG